MSCKSPYSRCVASSAAATALVLALVALPCGSFAGPLVGTVELSTVGRSTPGAVFLGIDREDRTGGVAPAGDFNRDGIDDFLIAAPQADVDDNQRAGKVYLIYGRSEPFSGEIDLADIGASVPGVTFTGTDRLGRAGYSIASAGDVNDDGLDDFLIGAPGDYVGGKRDAGRAYLVYGQNWLSGTVNLSDINGAIFEGNEDSDATGYSVAAAGDVDGDGRDDILIGAPGSFAVSGAGDKVYLIYGQTGRNELYDTIDLATVGQTTAGAVVTGVSSLAMTPNYLSPTGDVNLDGLDDFLIGANLATVNGAIATGETYLIYGRSDRATLTGILDVDALGTAGPRSILSGTTRGDHSGGAVSSGDFNGDKLSDVLIAAPFSARFGHGEGATYLIYGQGDPDVFSGRITLDAAVENTSGAIFTKGGSVSSAGDVNGDGLDDLLIGDSHAYPNGIGHAGQTYLVYGRSNDDPLSGIFDLQTLQSSTAGAIFNGTDRHDYSGAWVSSAGDVNGDGLDDLLIGAPQGSSDTGKVYLIYGQPLPEVFALASVASGHWNAAATWDDGTEVPLSFMDIEVRDHSVVVAEDGVAGTLQMIEPDGQVGVRPEATLRIFDRADVTAGTLALDWDALVHVMGDVYLGDQAVYQSQLRAPCYGQIDADGDVTLGGRLDLEAIGSISQPGDHQRTIVRAEGALTGDFSITPSPGQHLGNGIFYEGLVHLDGEEGAASTIDIQVFQAAAGDTNGDRQLDNADLQRILGANSFGRPGDWDWPQGDFNGDRHVDNRDLQRILATGYFGTGPYAASTPIPVPEPPALLLTLTAGTLGLLLWRRVARP